MTAVTGWPAAVSGTSTARPAALHGGGRHSPRHGRPCRTSGVESVVLIAGRPIAPAQVLQLPRRDHVHGQTGTQQRLADRAVWALDADLVYPGTEQPADHATQPRRGVLDAEPLPLPTIRTQRILTCRVDVPGAGRP